MPSFARRVVIITGAGSGIGRATAMKMASHAATLALADISADAVEETLSAYRGATADLSERHMTAAVDVGSSEACNQFVQRVVAEHGQVDHVFNCAGINPTKLDTESISDEYWDRLLRTNVKGVFNMTRACLPHMKAGASFINVSSIAGLQPAPQIAAYCASKFAVIGFSKSVALEVGSRGIRVNVIAPGMIETPTNMSVKEGGSALEAAAQDIGLRRVGTADEVADVAVFLFSDESRYMNGSVVEVNGGIGWKA